VQPLIPPAFFVALTPATNIGGCFGILLACVMTQNQSQKPAALWQKIQCASLSRNISRPEFILRESG
jgi:hypothetical protein